MEHTGSDVPSHDVAARVDPAGPVKGSAGEINSAELASAQQIAMVYIAGISIPSDNVAARVDPVHSGEGSTRKIK